MTLDAFRPQVAGVLDLMVRVALYLRVSPNLLSALSFFLALAAGILYAVGSVAGGLVCVAGNAVFDAVDGALARATGQQGPRGDFLDHAIDRYCWATFPVRRYRPSGLMARAIGGTPIPNRRISA